MIREKNNATESKKKKEQENEDEKRAMRGESEDHTKYRSKGRKYQMDKKRNIKISNGGETRGGEGREKEKERDRETEREREGSFELMNY